MPKVAILGAGAMGSGLANALVQAGWDVNLWGTWLDDHHQERQGLDDDTHGERASGGRAAVQGQERTADGGHPEKGDDDGDTGER